MEVNRFEEKLNKVDGNVYVIEEKALLTNGVYKGELKHDNINQTTLAVYTGPRLTGERIQTFALSTQSLTPWKRGIRIFASVPEVYITYETDGDTVEAEDINRLQEAVTKTQTAVNTEYERATRAEDAQREELDEETQRARDAETELSEAVAEETGRAEAAENGLSDNLTAEAVRAVAKELELQGNIDAHATAVDGEVQALKSADAALEQKKADISYINAELNKRYTKEQTYTKEEVLRQIEDLIGSAPEVLDTFKEIAEALGNDPDFAGTMMKELAGKVDKEVGKRLSANDYSDLEKAVVADVNSKKHTHGNKAVLDKLTQTMLDNLTSAFAHIGDTIKHVTSVERLNWNAAFTHAGRKDNPHVTTKAHVGLGDVENKNGAAIRGEMTKEEVVAALGYTPLVSAPTYTHPNSGAKAGTYRSVTINAQGHVTAGANPTTLAEYGITDAMLKGPFTWVQMRGAYTWNQLKGV